MSALAEALLAAQRQAVGTLSKAFVAGKVSGDELRGKLTTIGCADEVDQEYLIDALIVVQTYGGEAPKPTGSPGVKMPEQPSEAQRNFIAKLCKERNVPEPDVIVSKEQAHEIIDALKAGTYNADAYTVPF